MWHEGIFSMFSYSVFLGKPDSSQPLGIISQVLGLNSAFAA